MSGAVGTAEKRLLVERKTFTFAEPPNEMVLDCGARLGPITLAYETLGELNAERTNAVLILHAFSGDSHVAGYLHQDDERPGWWDNMVGPGKPIDTNRYFVICSNILGSCCGSTGPSSINPETGKPYGLAFPMVTLKDMVTAQKQLIEHLCVTKLLSLVGGWGGGREGPIDLAPVSDAVPAEVKAQDETIKTGLKDGSFSIWKGPIMGTDGKEVLAAGAVADDKFLGGINFYVKGVEGSVPSSK